MILRLILPFLIFCAGPAGAQLDPSSAILLRGGTNAPNKEQLDRGRYTIRPGESREVIEPKRPATAPPPPPPKVSRPVPTAPAPPPAAGGVPAVVEATTSAEPPLTEKVQDLVLGGSPDDIASYRDSLADNDLRQNLVEIDLAPMFLYRDANANLWQRGYSYSSPGMEVAARIWVTPFFGIQLNNVSTFEGSIIAEPNSRNRISADLDQFSGGIRWRKFFAKAARAPGITLGLDFSESQLRVPANAVSRVRTKTSGVRLILAASLWLGRRHSWQYGVSVMPRAQHRERSTGLALKSGTGNETSVLGVWLGTTYVLDRRNQIFWRIGHEVERTLFDGAANTNDPVTGTAPTGVSVTTGTTMFSLGYRWGS